MFICFMKLVDRLRKIVRGDKSSGDNRDEVLLQVKREVDRRMALYAGFNNYYQDPLTSKFVG